MCFSKPTRQNDRTFATLNPYATKSANMNPNQTHTHTFKHKKWKLSMLRQRFYQKKNRKQNVRVEKLYWKQIYIYNIDLEAYIVESMQIKENKKLLLKIIGYERKNAHRHNKSNLL